MTFPSRGSSPSPSEYGHASASASSSTPPAPSCCSKTSATPGGRYPMTPCWYHLAGPAVADTLDGCWWAVELDGTRHDRAVRTWDTPPPDCPALASLAVVHHDLADQWLEEELPVYGMPQEPVPPSRRAALRPAHPGPRQRRAAGHHLPPGAHHRDRRATPLGTSRPATSDGTGSPPARSTPPASTRARPATGRSTAPTRRYRYGATSSRCQRPGAWPGSSASPMTTRQCNCSSTTPQPATRTPADARPRATRTGSRALGWADDIKAARSSGRAVGPLPAHGGHGGLSETDDDPAQSGHGIQLAAIKAGRMTIEGAYAVRHGFLLVRHPGPPRAALTRGASYWTAWYSLRLAWVHAR